MSFATAGAMGAVSAMEPNVADRMTRAICDIRKTRDCVRYEALSKEFTDQEIVENLREALFRAMRRSKGGLGFPDQIPVDEKIVATLARVPRLQPPAQTGARRRNRETVRA